MDKHEHGYHLNARHMLKKYMAVGFLLKSPYAFKNFRGLREAIIGEADYNGNKEVLTKYV